MAAIDQLLAQVTDPALRGRLREEFDRALQNKKFGLVFEEHMPECTPLYGVEIKRGGTVCKNDKKKIGTVYTVLKKTADTALCRNKVTGEMEEIQLSELVAVAEFGEAIFPCLQPIDKVENAPDSDLWHTLIEADNYHALQLLEYLYTGKVDCIYIDPPYNTGAKDWKYNNDYVDGADTYRHSKWLSMMKKRLALAKRLLNPADSVLIVTIDEKEYLHLGCLLEEMFPEARMQMITSCINPNGAARNKLFTRVDEYIFYVMLGESSPALTPRNMLDKEVQSTESVTWFSLIRTGSNSLRQHSENCFYPIYIEDKTGKIKHIGEPVGRGISKDTVHAMEGCSMIWPLHGNGAEGVWQLGIDELKKRIEIGAIRVSKKKGTFVLTYLRQGQLNEISDGKIAVVHRDENGTMVLKRVADQLVQARTMWNQASHDATTFGSKFIKQILIDPNAFKYPKSLYAVHDAIRFFVANKPNALILDFFAGSGTTLHAVNLLNAEDGGHRRCIMVTNNEVSVDEAKTLTEQGYRPGDEEWEKYGIARYVTWPRTVCSIEGHDVNGAALKGNYISDKEISMADGFAANCEYFKLGFLERDRVSLGMQFEEILPLLWLKSGAVGKRPELKFDEEPIMLVLPENRFAVLVEEAAFSAFAKEIAACDSIDTVYFVTNSESAFHEMSAGISVKNTHQLYREYIDNFVIGARRDAK